MIYYLLAENEWESVRHEAVVVSPGPDGYVHCCDEHQVAGVRATFFPGDIAVLALRLDPTQLAAETRYEPGSRGERDRFPHVHGPIRRSEVVDWAAVSNSVM